MILKNLTQYELKVLKEEKEKEARSCLNAAQDIETADLYLESYSKIEQEIKKINKLIIE